MNDLLDTLAYYRDRLICKVTGFIHGPGCRGREDHSPYRGKWWS